MNRAMLDLKNLILNHQYKNLWGDLIHFKIVELEEILSKAEVEGKLTMIS